MVPTKYLNVSLYNIEKSVLESQLRNVSTLRVNSVSNMIIFDAGLTVENQKKKIKNI